MVEVVNSDLSLKNVRLLVNVLPLLAKTTFASIEFVKKDRKASNLDTQVLHLMFLIEMELL